MIERALVWREAFVPSPFLTARSSSRKAARGSKPGSTARARPQAPWKRSDGALTSCERRRREAAACGHVDRGGEQRGLFARRQGAVAVLIDAINRVNAM